MVPLRQLCAVPNRLSGACTALPHAVGRLHLMAVTASHGGRPRESSVVSRSVMCGPPVRGSLLPPDGWVSYVCTWERGRREGRGECDIIWLQGPWA